VINRLRGPGALAGILGAVLLVCVCSPPARAQTGSAVERGQAVFETRCASCHTLGSGDGVGPDLKSVTLRREARWLVRYIREPDVMAREGDAVAVALRLQYRPNTMPDLGVSENEAVFIVAFLAANASRKTVACPPAGRRRTG
jgi:protein SCO1